MFLMFFMLSAMLFNVFDYYDAICNVFLMFLTYDAKCNVLMCILLQEQHIDDRVVKGSPRL